MTVAPEQIITGEQTLAVLEKAVEDYGADYVDPNYGSAGCSYEYADGTNCIVGFVLKELGLPLPADNLSIWSLWASPISLDYKAFTGEAIDMLSYAQNAQDSGDRWGAILEDVKLGAHIDLSGFTPVEEPVEEEELSDEGEAFAEQIAWEIEQTNRWLAVMR